MDIFLWIFLVSLLCGTITGIPIASGVVLYLHDLVLFLGGIYYGISFIQKKIRIVPYLSKPIIYFIAVAILSLIVNITRFPWQSILVGSLYLWRWIAYALLYGVCVQQIGRGNDITKKMFTYGCAFGILGILQFIFYPNLRFLLYLGWDPHYYRLFSTVLDPNFAGILLVLSVLLGYYLFSTEKKLSYAVASIFLLCCVYLTYSRSSYLAMAIGALVYTLLQKQWRILGIVAIFIAIIFIVPRPGGNTLRLWREDSTYSRFSNWKESAALFMTAPILGHGFNTLRFIQTPTIVDSTSFVSHAAAGVDSSILFLLVTTGVIGTVFYLSIYYAAGVRSKKNKESAAIRILYISSIAAVLMHSLFVNSLFYPWILCWFWMLIAAVELIYDRK